MPQPNLFIKVTIHNRERISPSKTCRGLAMSILRWELLKGRDPWQLPDGHITSVQEELAAVTQFKVGFQGVTRRYRKTPDGLPTLEMLQGGLNKIGLDFPILLEMTRVHSPDTVLTLDPRILNYGWAITALAIGYIRNPHRRHNTITYKEDVRNLQERLELWFAQDWALDPSITWYHKWNNVKVYINDQRCCFEAIFNGRVGWLPQGHPIKEFSEKYVGK